jgi:hypothetical protein
VETTHAGIVTDQPETDAPNAEPSDDASSHQVNSEPGEPLGTFVLRAASVSSRHQTPLGVLQLVGRVAGDEPVDIAIETGFGGGAIGGVQRLDVRVRTTRRAAMTDELLRAALTKFGGTAYTSFVLTRPNGEELVDLSLSFGSRVPWLASNTALFDAPAVAGDAEALRELFSCLGVRTRGSGPSMRVAPRQLRAVLTDDEQARAFRRSVERGFVTTLYASTLPARQAVRVELGPDGTLDLTLSRGLASEHGCTAADYRQLESFLREQLALDIGGKSWRLTNFHGDLAERDHAGVIAPRKKLTYSVNWGVRRS